MVEQELPGAQCIVTFGDAVMMHSNGKVFVTLMGGLAGGVTPAVNIGDCAAPATTTIVQGVGQGHYST